MEFPILLAVLVGIAVLLIQILVLRFPAFIALLVASIVTGVLGGLSGSLVIEAIEKGMGSTLGFVATIVGLGAIFGGILEKSGGAQALAKALIKSFGENRASLAMVITGMILAIPIFFDVAFVILVPVIYALQKSSGKSLLIFALPLLAGLGMAHTFIPPTPGPVAVADILHADLGYVMIVGLLGGLPAALLSGLVYGRFVGEKIFISAPHEEVGGVSPTQMPHLLSLSVTMTAPLLLIVLGSLVKANLLALPEGWFRSTLLLVGHPFAALVMANLLAWYLLGVRGGLKPSELLQVSNQSFKPVGLIVLCTGAGGVFKQVLMDTGAGNAIATQLAASGLPVIAFAFIASSIIRIAQGSATVAMITAAGLVSPVLLQGSFSQIQLAAFVLAIASGASICSHVNDSGFWMVKQYLGMTEQQTFKTWTVLTTILAITGFGASVIIFLLF